MEFSLLYEGTIPTASKTKTRSAEKHAIRKALHPQLKRLWQTNQQLRLLAADTARPISSSPLAVTDEGVTEGLQKIGSLFKGSAGFKFVPLVTEHLFLRCSVDVLLLRPNEKRFLFTQGDIDGQLKTIFDALRMPNSPQETVGAPNESEDPFFCLLQDDRLISEVKVTTQDLLLLPGEKELKANHAFAVIHIKVNELYPTTIMNFPYADLLEARANTITE